MACMSLGFRVLSPQIPVSITSPSSSSRRAVTSFSGIRARAAAGAASPPMLPLNPNDPFLSKLAYIAAANPDLVAMPPPSNPEIPPFLDLFDSPKLMATPAQVERSVSYNEHRPRKPPPDLPSLLLHGRIVYIGMPLVPAVTELVIAELMYLQWMDPKQPIYLYINSTGTTRDDGETNLYNANVRKVVVMGLAPIGCTPHYLWEYKSVNGECVDAINNVVVNFNYAMRYMVDELNRNLSDAMIIFYDAFEGSMDILANRRRYGFETTTDACCGFDKYGGFMMCLLPEMACNDASTHVWWDEFHPTEAVNRILADNVWSGMHTSMCYPMNLKGMIRLSL